MKAQPWRLLTVRSSPATQQQVPMAMVPVAGGWIELEPQWGRLGPQAKS
jgi:hypothetical protein